MKRGTKIGLGVGTVVVLGAIVVVGATRRGGDATPVRVEEVAKADLVSVVNGNGWIRPTRSVDVQSDIIGRVVELNVQEGDAVTSGQLLLRIDPSQYEAATARARAAVSEARAGEAQARANLLQAQRVLERNEGLAESDANLISTQALEEARSAVEVQTAMHEASTYRVAQANAALREAQDQLSKTVIRSPIDGVVTRLNVDIGETAIVGTMNNAGSLLLTISDLDVIEAVVKVDETDLPQIALGDSAAVEIDAFPRRTFTGRVTEIAHSALNSPEQIARTGGQAQAVDFQVVIRLDEPPPTLRPDFSATADVVTDTRSGVLAIPIIALTVRDAEDVEALPQESPEAAAAAAEFDEEDEVEGVFVVREGVARFVPVTVGIAGADQFEVVHGLEAGDSVIAGPYQAIRNLSDGDAVRVMLEGLGGEGRTASAEEGEDS
ncbi:MAG TPA: efflux RND transporter periplasmic adaptor subunit [Longimicrobiales bacterium]|nr:efflux RND transporter periplasmic adaptor subunit [Longimicrobiales bacterium]